MTATAAWRWCVAAGSLVVACSIGFGHIPGLHPCGDARGLGPIIGFELSTTPGEVARLFGAEPCRSRLVGAQRTALWLDALGFIPSYTAFLCLAAWATGARWRRWIVAAVLVAFLCDEVEGPLLDAILRDLPGTPGLIGGLWWETHVKFVLLGLGTVGIGAALIGSRRMPAILMGVIAAVNGVGAIGALLGGQLRLMPHLTVAWGALLLLALIAAVWPRLLAPRLPAPTPPSA